MAYSSLQRSNASCIDTKRPTELLLQLLCFCVVNLCNVVSQLLGCRLISGPGISDTALKGKQELPSETNKMFYFLQPSSSLFDLYLLRTESRFQRHVENFSFIGTLQSNLNFSKSQNFWSMCKVDILISRFRQPGKDLILHANIILDLYIRLCLRSNSNRHNLVWRHWNTLDIQL